MNIDEIAAQTLTELQEETNNPEWNKGKYREIKKLEIDKRGSFGERLVRDIFSKERNISIDYQDGDQGDWDIKINNVKIEIKTSCLGKNEKFQNENIKNTQNCDFVCFVGVAPDNLFMRLDKISEIDFDKLHNRKKKGTGAGYKWDFKKEQMIEVKTREEVVALFYKKMGLDKKLIKKNLKSKQ